MAGIYVTSPTARAGRTAFAASLGAHLASQGKRVGYFKPVALADEAGASAEDADARFCKEALSLSESVAELAPVTATAQELAGGLGGAADRVRQAWAKVSKGKDVVIVEGLPAAEGLEAASKEIADVVDGRVVALVRHRRGMSSGEVAKVERGFGDRFVGVVLNGVAEVSLRTAREELQPALASEGINVLGIIPEDRKLLGFTVAEYGDRLGGTIHERNDDVNGEAGEMFRARMDSIVEHLLVGAMVVDSSQYYYERVPGKALITRTDRPDLQWNALDEKTLCLILTGGGEPIAYVTDKADSVGVPIIKVARGTLETIDDIEGFVTSPSVHHPQKLERFAELLREHVNLRGVGV